METNSRLETIKEQYKVVEKTSAPLAYGSSKPGPQPLGDKKRTERIVLKMTKTQFERLKDKHGRIPLATALMDHCEKTGFFPKSNVEDDDTDASPSGK